MNDVSWPYEYGSDLHWLWGWGERIGDWLNESEKPSLTYAQMVFLPDRLAVDAIQRFGAKYPAVIRELQGYRDFAEARFHDQPRSDDAFINAVSDLQERIWTTAKIIGKASFNEDRRSGWTKWMPRGDAYSLFPKSNTWCRGELSAWIENGDAETKSKRGDVRFCVTFLTEMGAKMPT